MRLVDDLNHLVFGLLDGRDNVGVGGGISDGVADTDAVALEEQPVVDDRLNVAVEFAVFLKKVQKSNLWRSRNVRWYPVVTPDKEKFLFEQFQTINVR